MKFGLAVLILLLIGIPSWAQPSPRAQLDEIKTTAGSSPLGRPRAVALLREMVRSHPHSRWAAEALSLLADLSQTEKEWHMWVDRLVREYPNSPWGLQAHFTDISTRKLPLPRYLQEVDHLLRRAGGVGLSRLAGTTEPWVLHPDRDWQQESFEAFLAEIYERTWGALKGAGRAQEALEIYRFLRVQFPNSQQTYRAMRQLAECRYGQNWGKDHVPPRVVAILPHPDALVTQSSEIFFELHDGEIEESQVDLTTLKVRLDSRNITGQLKRRHFLDLSGGSGVTFERIEFSYRTPNGLIPGPHRLRVDVCDGVGNPAAVAWTWFVFGGVQAAFQSDEDALSQLGQHPELAWRYWQDRDTVPCTPLAQAAGRNWLKTAKWLLDHGAPAGCADAPLAVAAGGGHVDMLHLLLQRGGARSPGFPPGGALTMAARSKRVEILRLLLEAGVKPGPQDAGLLVEVAASGNAQAVELLLPVIVDAAKRSEAFQRAASGGKSDVIAVLLRCGCNPNARTSEGSTPLHLAAASRETGRAASVRLLLEAGADPRALDAAGRTPLEAAGGEQAPLEVRKELLQHNGGW